MQWSDIQFAPPRKTLRQFAALWLVFFGLLALWEAIGRSRTGIAYGLAIVALTIGPIGLVKPEWMRLIYVGWMIVAFPIGWTISNLTLAALYFGVFTPISLAFRLAGRDPLKLKRQDGADSYWEPKPTPTDLRRYFKQF
jgi:hypothetical protein